MQNSGETREQVEALRRSVARLAVAVAVADGRLAREELELVGQLDRIGLGSISQAVQEELQGATRGDLELSSACATLRSAGDHVAETILSALYQLAVSDGQVSAQEDAALQRIAELLGIRGPVVDRAQVAAAPGRAEASRPTPEEGPVGRALSILGLDSSASAVDAERAYLELLARYNPSRVQELGADFAALAVRKLYEATLAWETVARFLSGNSR